MIYRQLTLLFLATLLFLPATADEGELREAIRTHFENGLRQTLALSDEQMAAILPRVERIEASKREATRRRQETVRALQQGMQQGADDARLQELLDSLEREELEQQRLERELLSEIDQHLTVRQRVQLRFFVQHFRSEFRRRMEDLRGGRRDRPRRRDRDRP